MDLPVIEITEVDREVVVMKGASGMEVEVVMMEVTAEADLMEVEMEVVKEEGLMKMEVKMRLLIRERWTWRWWLWKGHAGWRCGDGDDGGDGASGAEGGGVRLVKMEIEMGLLEILVVFVLMIFSLVFSCVCSRV